MITTTNPRTGVIADTGLHETRATEVDAWLTKRLFRLRRATCFSRLRPAGAGGYRPTVSVVVG